MRRSHSIRALALAVSVLAAGACEGGEGVLSGCGFDPIPGGFPEAERVANAGQGRITSSGLTFLEGELPRLLSDDGSGVLRSDISDRNVNTGFGTGTICPDGGCNLDATIRSTQLTLTGANQVQVTLVMEIQTADEAGALLDVPVAPGISGTTCLATANTLASGGARPTVQLSARFALREESRTPRTGYTTLAQLSAWSFDPGQELEAADVTVVDGGGGGVFNCSLLGSIIRDQVGIFVADEVGARAQEALDRLVCTRPGETGCPVETTETSEGVCVFDSAPSQCVPTLIGGDGQGNPSGQLLSGFSPGARGYLQTLLAAGGDGENIDQGISLFFYGGMRSTDAMFSASPVHDPCVPERPAPTTPIIPRANALQSNDIPGLGTPIDVAFALSESYLNYASYFVFDSGGLCAAAGAPSSPQLHTGVTSLLVGSLEELSYPRAEAPIAVSLRPQLPPVIELGDDDTQPDVLVSLNQLVFDFYVYTLDRYVRVLSFRTDVTLPLELDIESGALRPRFGAMTMANSEVTESELLPEAPTQLASAIEAALPLVVEPLLSDLPALTLPQVIGIDLSIPDGGIQNVEQGGDEFVTVYANFAAPDGEAVVSEVDTAVSVEAFAFDPGALALDRFGDGAPPVVHFVGEARGPAGLRYEYSHRLDGMTWSAWSEAAEVSLAAEALRLQGEHVLEVRARAVGAPASVDPSPARARLLVDALAPSVWLEVRDGAYLVVADDVVSRALEARVSSHGETYTEWAPLASLAPFAEPPAEVQVRDEAGNVGSTQAALIRGIPDPNADGGCGCRAVGSRSGGAALAWMLGLFGVLALRLKRKRRPAKRSPHPRTVSLLGLLLLGCPSPSTGCDPACPAPEAGSAMGSLCCDDACVSYDLSTVCGGGLVCASHDDISLDATCTASCSACAAPPPLEPGMLATELSATATPVGQVLIAGYDPGRFGALPFGDLVAGTWGGGDRIDWEIVDGVPDESPAFDRATWRGGVGAPGDDVGQHASAASSDDHTYIAYYDATHGALKLAYRSDGDWTILTVDDEADSGRYAALTITSGSSPAVAYRRLAPATEPGRFVSSVQVAVATSAEPTGAGDFTIVEVASSPTPCRPALCGSGEVCLASGVCATPSDDCAEACTGSNVCRAAACVPALPDPYVEPLPPGIGLYVGLDAAPDGQLGLIYYDRNEGTLYGARQVADAWQGPFAVAGYGAGQDADAGIGASLTIDRQGDWHISYVDASAETLSYARVRGDEIARSMVDDGSTDGAARNPDGRHLVGDDSSIVTVPTGEVRIAYQDATALETRVATRAALGDPWVVRIVDADDFTGFYVDQLLGAGRSFVISAHRGPVASGTFGVRVLQPELMP